ncbi:M28 family peptidase [Rubrolithibacter danxiaensis]|uniref:M28 family peptidase n=1 Tax=Rubrolithibacter danxiaensis TaxID=3390805 RepID=UPI003BF8791A
MRKISLLTIGIGLSLQVLGQNPVAEKYAKFIDTVDARKHLSILASDEFEGRETGTPGAEKAANYIAGEFKKLGLKAPVNGSYFQQVPLIETKFEVSSFLVNSQAFENGKDFYFSGTPQSQTIKTNELVFIGYGISSENYDDLKGTDVTGKIVLLINKGEPVKDGVSAVTKSSETSDWSRSKAKRIQSLLSKNPAAILAVSPDVDPLLKKYPGYFTEGRLSLKKESSETEKAKTPIINITPEVADKLLQSTGKSYESLKAAIDNSGKPATQVVKADFSTSFGLQNRDVTAVNVLGYLEGKDLKNELVVVSAHYDHIGLTNEGTDKVNNGADDDGSGTTGILEIARAFSKAKAEGKGPRRSILFLGNVGEEKGLLGSEWYSEHPVFPLENTITNLNIDMIGRVDSVHQSNPNYCYLIGSDKLSTDLHKISEKANATYTKLDLDYKYNDPNDPERIYYRSDHYNFAKHNIPIIFYFNGVHEDYHKPSDEISKIRFDLLVKRARLVFYTCWDLVNRDKRPVVDKKTDMAE